MAVASDMVDTIELIRDFWGDLKFEQSDIVSGNPDFIVRFYSTFIAELNDKLSYLLNEDVIPYEFDDIQDFEPQVVLYCKVAKQYKKMNYASISLTLGDFYMPHGKKMYPFVKFSIHFVIFINNYLDVMANVINKTFIRLDDIERIKTLKEQNLQHTAENSENIARYVDIFQKLILQYEELKNLHMKMKEDKSIQDNIFSEKEAEVTDLKNEIENLEYELQLSEIKETELKENVITEKEFENLKNTAECLELEQQQLYNESFGADVIHDLEHLNRSEEYVKQLKSVDLESLNINDLLNCKREAEQIKNIQFNTIGELDELNENLSRKRKKIDHLNYTLDQVHGSVTELKTQFMMKEVEEQKFFTAENEQSAIKFEKCQRVETQISAIEEEMREIVEEERKFNACAAQKYQKLLTLDKKATMKFHKMLLNLEMPR